ncbi:hypothetical protein [Adhaeribacter soli]|uniref:PorT family protein n=1 Tax=Adhaeribacter soli TaxID=2607655 RepID=A0A5N1IN14_9BACT|nr:hypothetical protein [Adhaeribacter soli]KAA9331118.1 hypothetical protein F0P94_14550 [Adhaeribacter soli]
MSWFTGLLAAVSLPLSAAVPADSALVNTLQPKVRFVFNFDTRYTLLDNDRARISGLKTGLEWKNKYRAGLGYYFLSSPLVTQLPVAADQAPVEARVKFAYVAGYGEYVFLKTERWEASVPLQIGVGKTLNQYHNQQGQVVNTERVPLLLFEPSVSGHYKIYNWVGVGAGAGYRHMLNQARQETSHLNAPIYYVKAKLFVGELYRQVKRKHCRKAV